MPYLAGHVVSSGTEWPEFWISEASLEAMPITHIHILVEYFQAGRSITAGNSFDRIHACYLQTHDRIVTADADFYDALQFVKSQRVLRGTPVLVKRKVGTSALAELQKTL